MKTIIRLETNVSLYIFEDNIPVVASDVNTTVGDPVTEVINDCSTTNSVLYENVVSPEDWKPWKYLFDGTNWTLNPGYIPPKPIPVQE